jgi:hypothetical protein
MSLRKPKFPYPYFIDHKRKHVWFYVASGWPTCMGIPHWMKKYFYDLEGYTASMCKEQTFIDIQNEQKESS